MAGVVDKVYAMAIFEIAVEKNMLDDYKSELDAISVVFKEQKDFFEFFRSPRIRKDKKKEVINNIFKDKVSDDILNFLFVLIDKKRGYRIDGIAREFSILYDEKNKIVDAHVKSVVELDDNTKKNLISKLSDISGKHIRLTCEVDKSIIGGLWVKVGDKVIDSTVKEELKRLKMCFDRTIV